MPEFQGRQVVTLHNQRDFLFFRRHRYAFLVPPGHAELIVVCLSRSRYAFRSPEKVALQEIGPRFTLKLRYLKKGLPAVKNLGAPSKPLAFDAGEEPQDTDMKDAAAEEKEAANGSQEYVRKEVVPPTEDEYLWMWKVCQLLFPRRNGLTEHLAGARDNSADVFPVTLSFVSPLSFGAHFHISVSYTCLYTGFAYT